MNSALSFWIDIKIALHLHKHQDSLKYQFLLFLLILLLFPMIPFAQHSKQWLYLTYRCLACHFPREPWDLKLLKVSPEHHAGVCPSERACLVRGRNLPAMMSVAKNFLISFPIIKTLPW